VAGRPSVASRPSEAGHWYSGHFSDDEHETDMARLTDFGEPPPEPSLADRAVLLRMEGVEAGRVYSLGMEPARLGRHPDNECVIDDAGISRFHAVIKWERGAHVVEDLQSRNGTFVKGQRTVRSVIRDGDLVQLGPKVGLRYSLVDDRQETLLKRLYDSSNRDALTGAYNRKHYTDRLATEVAYAERHKTEVSIIMLDIDHFKRVNDTLGHAAGDVLLKQLANTVLRQLRTEDVFARIGGEEFVVILRGIPLVGAARLAERLRATVAALPAMYNGNVIPVTISLGCASLNELKHADVNEFAVLADMRLYAAKQAGRNRVVARGQG
jgi:diguanylate cyclase (GGDEF)-like protein